MDAAQFDYHLPQACIAQVPSDRRDHSRLLLVNRSTGQVADHFFRELPDLLPDNSVCFRNNVSVLKARLHGQRESGGTVECLLLQPDAKGDPRHWWCLLRPGKKLPEGSSFHAPGFFAAHILKKAANGQALVAFDLERHESVPSMAQEAGEMPLPPYIKREKEDMRKAIDDERYQTVYADPAKPHAVAAPTAGLHFTPQVVSRMETMGHCFHDLTLHVGLGTFKPIQSERVEDHDMHEEYYEIPSSSVQQLTDPGIATRLAIGTTSLRAMEDFFRSTREQPADPKHPFSKFADLYVYPPATFTTNALLTNFHLPRSTLLCLVSAFLSPGSTEGIQWLRQIYEAAIDRKYRFYSYGDAMLIL